jgi:hypothetical protein
MIYDLKHLSIVYDFFRDYKDLFFIFNSNLVAIRRLINRSLSFFFLLLYSINMTIKLIPFSFLIIIYRMNTTSDKK